MWSDEKLSELRMRAEMWNERHTARAIWLPESRQHPDVQAAATDGVRCECGAYCWCDPGVAEHLMEACE